MAENHQNTHTSNFTTNSLPLILNPQSESHYKHQHAQPSSAPF
jgi:hypothetical protein